MKPYQTVPIQDCGEPLVPIPRNQIDVVEPHFYEALGAPYGDKSPYYLRQGVLTALLQAQIVLEQTHSAWRIQVFDAFRPIAVQQFMVDFTFRELLQLQGFEPARLADDQRRALMDQVYQFWAPPSLDLSTPPPHSTGAAVDITLVDAHREPVDMGSPIDEVSPRSFPDYFAASQDPVEQQWHQNRTLLNQVMTTVGFRRHPNEWWHFSLGDQFWAWIRRQETGNDAVVARYGRVLETATAAAEAAAALSPKTDSFAPLPPKPDTAPYPSAD